MVANAMILMQKLFQVGIKVSHRALLYLRGFCLYLKIRACGGVCESVPRVEQGLVLRYPPHAGLKLGRGVRIGPNCLIECPPGAKLHIGDRVGLTAGVVLSAHEKVVIGNDCLLAEWVSVRDAEHGTHPGATIASQPLKHDAIRIEDDVWIGKGTIVLQGAVIQRGCVIGANSFFKSKTSEEFAIYAGVPAIRIKARTSQ
jgi:acetyltransferase-like isoleucine patch superfamily enzyme